MSESTWFTRLWDVLTRYSDSRMFGYLRWFYQGVRVNYGSNDSYTGVGDIVGCLGPFGIAAAVFLLLALIFRKGKNRFSAFCAFLAFVFDGAWYFLWLRLGEGFFLAGYQIALTVCIAVAVLAFLLFIRKRSAPKQEKNAKQPEKPAEQPQAKDDEEFKAETEKLQREMADIERQLEEIKRRKEEMENFH